MHRGLQAIYEYLYGRGTTGRLKQAGMEFAVWTFKHGASSQLEEAGPGILQALLSLLEDGAPCIPSLGFMLQLGSCFMPRQHSELYIPSAIWPVRGAAYRTDEMVLDGCIR